MGADSLREERAALTLRGIEREYHVSREYPSALIRLGVLPALRRGRAWLVLRRDWESLWTTQRGTAEQNRERIVEARLAREARQRSRESLP